MSNPVQRSAASNAVYTAPSSHSPDEMFGYNDEFASDLEPVENSDQQMKDEIWAAHWEAVQSGSYLKVYQLAEKYRFKLSEPFTISAILHDSLLTASKKEHFVFLRKVALAEQMFCPNSIYARAIQALEYFISGNRESAFAILRDTKDETINIEVGAELGRMIVEYRANKIVLQHLLELMAFFSKSLPVRKPSNGD